MKFNIDGPMLIVVTYKFFPYWSIHMLSSNLTYYFY